MVYKYDLAPEPIPAEAMHMSPPCRVSTHRSRVVDPDGPPTFLDHREAVPGIPHMTSLTKMLEHPDPLPIESSPPPISACSEAIRKRLHSIAASSCSILAVMKHRATARSEAVQHKMYMTDLDHSSTGLYTVLIVLTVPSAPTMPGVRPLNHPAFLQVRKAFR